MKSQWLVQDQSVESTDADKTFCAPTALGKPCFATGPPIGEDTSQPLRNLTTPDFQRSEFRLICLQPFSDSIHPLLP